MLWYDNKARSESMLRACEKTSSLPRAPGLTPPPVPRESAPQLSGPPGAPPPGLRPTPHTREIAMQPTCGVKTATAVPALFFSIECCVEWKFYYLKLIMYVWFIGRMIVNLYISNGFFEKCIIKVIFLKEEIENIILLFFYFFCGCFQFKICFRIWFFVIVE